MFGDRETIIDDEDDFHIINSPSMECPNQGMIIWDKKFGRGREYFLLFKS